MTGQAVLPATAPQMPAAPAVKDLGLAPYEPTWAAMRAFTAARGPGSRDELWLLQHPPVYTLGLNGRPEHLPRAGTIPVVKTDRGGQVTYHGPGQIVAYLLLDLRRRAMGVRSLVALMEQAIIELLAEDGIAAERRPGAPGVYVAGAKIAALGLRIKQGCSYHGLSLNVDMDLTPFHAIDPCGYPGLQVTQMRDLGLDQTPATVAARLAETLLNLLGETT